MRSFVLVFLAASTCEAACSSDTCDEMAKSSILQMTERSSKPVAVVERGDLTALRQMMEDVKQQVGDESYSMITPEVKSGIDAMIGLCEEIEDAIEADHKAAQKTMDEAVVRLEALTEAVVTLKRGGGEGNSGVDADGNPVSADDHDVDLVACREMEGSGLQVWEDCKKEEEDMTIDKNQKCAMQESLRTMSWTLNGNLQGEKVCDWTTELGNPARGCGDYDNLHTQGIDPVIAQFDSEKAEYVSWRTKCNSAKEALQQKIAECVANWDSYAALRKQCETKDGQTALKECEFGEKLQQKCEQLQITNNLVESIQTTGEVEVSDADRRKEWEAVQEIKCLLQQYEEGGTFSGEPCNIGEYPHSHDYHDAKREDLTSTENFHCDEVTITFSGTKWATGDTASAYQSFEWHPNVVVDSLETPPFEWCGTEVPPTLAPSDVEISSDSLKEKWHFVGCYVDDKHRMYDDGPGASVRWWTTDQCYNECWAKYKYFSMQYQGECFCGNEKPSGLEPYVKKNDDECGSVEETFNGRGGGDWRNAVYEIALDS